jgi:hypothetical protein
MLLLEAREDGQPVNPHQLAVITLTVIGFPACTVRES